MAIQSHNYVATCQRATLPRSCIAIKGGGFLTVVTKGGGILRPPSPFCVTFSGYVAMWLCGYVAVKLCGYAAMWLCAYVAMWLCCERIPWCASIAILILWATPSAAGPRSLLIALCHWDCRFLALLQTDLDIFGTQTCHLTCL